MDYITFAADRLEQHRASTLDREIERRRRVLDQGITIAPTRPELAPKHTLGVWFRRRRSAARIGISY
jgi:hypothetical protein